MQDKVSIIIPVYNQKKDFISRCFQSAIKQDYENVEIIFVDDESTDDTFDYCKILCDGKNNCMVLRQEHKRQGGARNTGVSAASGKYIFFLDSDDWIESNTISKLVSLIKQYNAQIAVCGCFKQTSEGEILKDNSIEEKITVLDRYHALESYVFDTEYCNHSPCDKLYDIKLFEHEKFVEKSYYEDLGSIYKFVRHADKIVHTNVQLYCYYDNLNSSMHTPFSEHEFDKVKYYHEISRYFSEEDAKLYESFIIESDKQTMYTAIRFIDGAYKHGLNDNLKTRIKDTQKICKSIKSRISRRLNFIRKLIIISPKMFSIIWRLYAKRGEK